ncbi:TetR family transcriptional regulator [Streptomyces sp. NPDC002588]|uniref:TetR/AcrR family transcriptional regulator n=1 Tax=Streptomyces sp. NPDC002588 TaxID=3154419 RepID=UPI00331D2C8E
MEIARAAAGLFAARGPRATRAEDIAQAAGIAPRTFYRYFATKEEAVAPLYAAGAQRWTEAVREAPPELPVPAALERAVHHTLVPGEGVSAASWQWVRTLIRMAGTNPGLGKVWAEVCQASEETLAEVLAARLSRGDGPREGVPSDNVSHDSGSGGGGGCGGGNESRGITPHQRFAAAVASAAVRVAMESWAAAETPAAGPDGPAELALRNLRALRGFAWEDDRNRGGRQ